MINEIGSILRSPEVTAPIPNEYWNLSGAMYAYIFLELTKIGVEVAGESQLVGYPTQFPDVSMMNWENGKPNARYWVLKLLKNNFGPGDKLVSTLWHEGTNGQPSSVASQAIITKKGKKILLINKLNKDASIELPAGTKGAMVSSVDVTTGDNPPFQMRLQENSITLKPFSVTVLKLD
ncbi:MAG: hypothetical protein WKG06_43175 [Segetibacter sp.]